MAASGGKWLAIAVCCLCAGFVAQPAAAALPGVNGRVLIGGVSSWTLLSVEPDGSDPLEQPAPSDATRVVLAPDGPRWVAFADGTDPGTYDWTFRRLDGSDPQVVEGVPSGVDQAAISPDGERVAFSSSDPGGSPPLYVAEIAGQDSPTQIAVHGAAAIPGLARAVWTPNGTELVGVTLDGTSGNPRYFHVGVVTVATGEARDAFTFANPNWHSFISAPRADTIDVLVEGLDVSPDGTAVAFVRNRQRMNGCPSPPNPICETLPNYQLVSVPLSGGAETVLAESGEYQNRVVPPTCTVAPAGGRPDKTPSWSPDGTEIAVAWRVETYGTDPNTCTYSNVSSLRAVPAEGGAPRVLASGGSIHPAFAQPLWSRRPAPVIFIHGFLASKLRCGSEELWPHLGALDRPRLTDMGLADDGITDVPGPLGCGPVQPDGVVEHAGGDIHASTLAFLRRTSPGANYVYAWDWRKSPQHSLAGLEDLIDQVRLANGDQPVAILAHSFGGLLTRWFLDDPTRASKVARALIVGTPSWGAPKAIFPLATGQETPLGAIGLDLFIDNDEMKTFARNLAGAYFLYPSGPFGRWLSVRGRVPDDLDDLAKVADYVAGDLDGNRTLLEQAQDAHADVLDGWKTNGVDVRALVGTGMNTVVKVDFQPEQGITAPDRAVLTLGNGDETVPARSAVQGEPGTANPLGEDIPIHYACRVSHVPLASDAALTAAGADAFLTRAADLSASTSPCSNGGYVIEMAAVELGPRRLTRAAGPTSPSVEAAESAGKVDVIRFPAQTTVVTNDANPVGLTLPEGTKISVRRVDGEVNGAPQEYGPLPGGMQITTATGDLQVAAVTPPAPPPSEPPPVAPSGAPPAHGSGAPAAVSDRTPPKVTAKLRRKGRRYVVRLSASDRSGIRRIEYRLTKRGAWKRYRAPLTLRAAQVRALRVRATDRAGNRSRAIAVRLPR